jgi:hypothetical protein
MNYSTIILKVKEVLGNYSNKTVLIWDKSLIGDSPDYYDIKPGFKGTDKSNLIFDDLWTRLPPCMCHLTHI